MPTVGPGASKGAKGDAAAAAGKAADAAAAGGPVSQAQAARAAMAALNLADKFGGGAGAAAQSGPSAADSAAAAEAEAEKAAMEAAAAAMSEVDSGDVVLSGSMAARIVGMRRRAEESFLARSSHPDSPFSCTLHALSFSRTTQH